MTWNVLGILLVIGLSIEAIQDANKLQQKKYWVLLALYVLFGLGILVGEIYLVLGLVGVFIAGIVHQFVRKADLQPAPPPREGIEIDLSKLSTNQNVAASSTPASASAVSRSQVDAQNRVFSSQNSPQFNQLLAMTVSVADDPARAVVGKWTIEDGKIGNIGVTVEIFEDNTCRFSNNVTGTWEIKGSNQVMIAAQPFAAFSLTPHENMMNGGWIEIKGGQGIMSSVILKRIGAPSRESGPANADVIQQIATLYGANNKPSAHIFSDGTIKNAQGQVLGHVDPEGNVYAASSRYWGRVAENGDFFQKSGRDGEMHMGHVSEKGNITTKSGAPWGRVVLADNVTPPYPLPTLGGAAMILNLLAQMFGSPEML